MERATQVSETSDFKKQFDDLPYVSQRRVRAAIEKLRHDPALPGLNVERVRATTRKINSCRVTRSIRLIFEQAEEGIRLLAVGQHDRAYRAAMMHLIELDRTNGVRSQRAQEEESMTLFGTTDLVDDSWPDELDDIREEYLPSIRDAIDIALDEGTECRAPHIGFVDRVQPGVNVIPGNSSERCTPVLVAFCFDDDQFCDRLHEVEIHAGITCPDTRLVILVTSQWMPGEWKRNHEGTFGRLRAHCIVYFAGFGGLTPLRV